MYFEKLNELIKSKSQAVLAKEIGCSQSTISRLLNHCQIPAGALLLSLSEVTGVSSNEILKEVQGRKEELAESKKPRL